MKARLLRDIPEYGFRAGDKVDVLLVMEREKRVIIRRPSGKDGYCKLSEVQILCQT